MYNKSKIDKFHSLKRCKEVKKKQLYVLMKNHNRFNIMTDETCNYKILVLNFKK